MTIVNIKDETNFVSPYSTHIYQPGELKYLAIWIARVCTCVYVSSNLLLSTIGEVGFRGEFGE